MQETAGNAHLRAALAGVPDAFPGTFPVAAAPLSLIYLFWIYSFVSRAVTAFSQIYIYEMFGSVQLNIIAAIVFFTGIMIGFCIYGACGGRRLNAKHGFLLSFLFNGLGLILLPLAQDVPQACGALAIRGVGSGMFWLTIHTYELMETSDHERDIYSTALSAGDQIITSASPRLCDTSDLDLA